MGVAISATSAGLLQVSNGYVETGNTRYDFDIANRYPTNGNQTLCITVVDTERSDQRCFDGASQRYWVHHPQGTPANGSVSKHYTTTRAGLYT